jgi:hypothetical protein
MPYVIPSLRTKEDPKLDILSEKDFPILSGTGPSSKKFEGTAFALKAKEWEEQRREIEYRTQMENEKEERRKQRLADEALEYAIIMFPQSTVKKLEKATEIQKEEKSVESEWTEVKRKVRKEPKSKVNFDENPEDDYETDDSGFME